MIKKIHYVWLGGGKSPAVERCIKTWKSHCPNWEIIEWNESNFPVNKYPFIREAIKVRKFAFASDVIRLIVLAKFGGIYMDTDAEMIKNPSQYLTHAFVSSIEVLKVEGWNNLETEVSEDGILLRNGEHVQGVGLQAGFMYSEPNHPFITGYLHQVYDDGNKHFINKDGSFNQMIIDGYMMNYLNEHYGLKFRNTTQILKDDICIYDAGVFSTFHTRTNRTCIIHWYEQSWNKESSSFKRNLIVRLKSYFPGLYRILITEKTRIFK